MGEDVTDVDAMEGKKKMPIRARNITPILVVNHVTYSQQ